MTRSKIAQRIIDETPQEVRDAVKQYGDNLVAMTENEIVARFMGDKPKPYGLLYYNDSYNWFMPAWVKFRDLNFDDYSETESNPNRENHEDHVYHIGTCILKNTIEIAFDELVKGIEWYNSLKK